MASSKNQDIGLQDLLFNSAVACILLFIIFSIKIGGDSILQLYNNANKGGKFTGTVSLPVPNAKVKGKMQTIRMVELGDLGQDILNKFKDDMTIGSWNVKDAFGDDYDAERQVYFPKGENKVVYMLVTDTAPDSEITFSIKSSKIPSSTRLTIRARMIEGASMMQAEGSQWAGFNGFLEYPEEDVLAGRFTMVFKISDEKEDLFEILRR
jgi:hypothetical protein